MFTRQCQSCLQEVREDEICKCLTTRINSIRDKTKKFDNVSVFVINKDTEILVIHADNPENFTSPEIIEIFKGTRTLVVDNNTKFSIISNSDSNKDE
jgi:hypothetical protein